VILEEIVVYAIIKSGGKQYKVKPGDVVRLEKLDAEPGSQIELTEVLMIGGEQPQIGTPQVVGASVTAVVTRQAKLPKILILKKKRRQGYRKMRGHRQLFTEIFVSVITTAQGSVKANTQPKIYDADKAQEAKLKRIVSDQGAEVEAGTATKTATKAPAKRAVVKKAAKKAAPKKKSAGKKAGGKKTAGKKVAKKK
jgi:large subunit ribosomal protein L21